MAGGFIVVTALHQNWYEMDGGLATIGGWVAGALGVIGIAASVWWRGWVTERPMTPAKVTTSFFGIMALAESSMLAGFVFTMISHGGRPFMVGLASFAAALMIMLVSLNHIELASDGSATEMVR
jgi:hypothetical protein